MQNRILDKLLGLLIFIFSIALYSRCFDYSLINLDDYGYILSHPEIVHFDGVKSVAWCFSDVSGSIWMPLTRISYALDYALFGSWFGGFHVHSVTIHAINAVLVWLLLRMLLMAGLGDEGKFSNLICAVSALVWAIHPLRCESVVFLASRKDVLSFLCELLALIAWIKGTQSEELKRRLIHTTIAVVLFVFGAMYKPSVMTFPLLCLLLDIFILRRVRPLRYIIPVLIMICLGGFASWQQSVGGATAYGAHEPLWARLSVASAAFGIYLRNTVMPFWLACQCVQRWPLWPRFFIPGVILSVVWGWFLTKRILCYWAKRRDVVSVSWYDGFPALISFDFQVDYVMAGMAWFAIAIGPMLGISSFGYHAYADRFTYIPTFGLVLMLAYNLHVVVRRIGVVKTLVPMIFVLAILSVTTWWQTGFWRDDYTLFSRTVEIDGDSNDTAHLNIAMHCFEETHDLDKARYHFEKARKCGKAVLSHTLHIYALTLTELGCEDDIAQAVRDVCDAAADRYGKDRAFAIMHSSPGLSSEEMKIAAALRFTRIVRLLGRQPDLKEAKRELDGTRDWFSNSGVWRFLMWRYYVLSGEKDAAAAELNWLLKPEGKDEYSQFRYLRKEYKSWPCATRF